MLDVDNGMTLREEPRNTLVKTEVAMIRTIAALVVATACLVMGTALSQEKSPDGTVHLREGSVAVGIGFAWGGGTLNYKGQNYPLKIRGLSIGEAGVSKAEATGPVFNLARLQDFNGTYTAGGVEGTVAVGRGATALRNQNGVVIHLTSTTRGLNFKIAAEGVQITPAQ